MLNFFSDSDVHKHTIKTLIIVLLSFLFNYAYAVIVYGLLFILAILSPFINLVILLFVSVCTLYSNMMCSIVMNTYGIELDEVDTSEDEL